MYQFINYATKPFIFIDYAREKLDSGQFRGSLFSHQELAVATFLGKDIIAFRENKVKPDDGILQFIQANSIEFSDKHLLPDVVLSKTQEHNWDCNWRNELQARIDDPPFEIAHVGSIKNRAQWYHINIHNLHKSRMALECVVYIESIIDLISGQALDLELVEIKWKGIKTPRVAIPPGKQRSIGAFHIFEESQHTVNLGINSFLVDYEKFHQDYILNGPGKFEVTYIIFSESFAPLRVTYLLSLGRKFEEFEFEEKPKNRGSIL